MDTQTLAALEEAIEPYRQAGFVITSQTEGSLMLVARPARFSYVIFLLLLILVWPLAIMYYLALGGRGDRSVCFRVTSQGEIEVSGYTLAAAARERRRTRWLAGFFLGLPLLLLLALLVLRLAPHWWR